MSVEELLFEIQAGLPPECDLSIEHARRHMASASETDNAEQRRHDIDMAGRILICTCLTKD